MKPSGEDDFYSYKKVDGTFRSPVRDDTAVLHSANMRLNLEELCESLSACERR